MKIPRKGNEMALNVSRRSLVFIRDIRRPINPAVTKMERIKYRIRLRLFFFCFIDLIRSFAIIEGTDGIVNERPGWS